MSTFQISGLHVRRGGREILSAVDLELRSAGVVAVLGPNGAGKSTLLACMAALLRPRAGSVLLDGVCVHSLPGRERGRQIAFLPQLPEIAWAVDVQTLVGLGRIPHEGIASDTQNRAAVEHALRITATTQWAARNITELSGGERARVLLARLLATQPRWMLADEPFAGLDPAQQFEAAELLRVSAHEGAGVVLTMHDLTLAARIADRVVLLSEGHIVADGPPQVALTPDVLRRVYGVETEWLVASSRQKAPFIAIHGRHAG